MDLNVILLNGLCFCGSCSCVCLTCTSFQVAVGGEEYAGTVEPKLMGLGSKEGEVVVTVVAAVAQKYCVETTQYNVAEMVYFF